jgi:hypothetical protein
VRRFRSVSSFAFLVHPVPTISELRPHESNDLRTNVIAL